jgi:hypothetical protein
MAVETHVSGRDWRIGVYGVYDLFAQDAAGAVGGGSE